MGRLRRPVGWAVLVISCIAWAALFVVPFVEAPADELVAWGAGIFIFAEVTWWVGVVLLGPEVLALAKALWAWLRRLWGRRRE